MTALRSASRLMSTLPALGRTGLIAASVVTAASCGSSPSSPSPTDLRITSVTPAAGSTTGGTTVTIAGANFSSDVTVTIAGVAAAQVTVQSAASITVVLGARSSGGPGDVVVSTGARSAKLANGFTYVAPSGANQRPSVTIMRTVGSREKQPSGFADLNETLTVIASVSDAETPATQLTYEWTGPGTFMPDGTNASWKVPATLPSTPSPVTIGVNVTESFAEGGVTHRQTASATFTVQVHDSPKEIMDKGEDFLTLFSNSDVPTDQVLHNFSTTCDGGKGRANEASDVDKARLNYRQDFSKFRISRIPPVTYNFGGACVAFGDLGRIRPSDACSLYTVHWEVTWIRAAEGHKVGDREVTDGIDHVTAVLENNVWKLCHSDFKGGQLNMTTGVYKQVEW